MSDFWSSYYDSKIKGFSLTELSVVLVVIAAIIAAIAGGQTLLKKSQVGQVIADLNQFSKGIAKFESTYDAIPGDVVATTNIGPGLTAGDGGGSLNGTEDENAWEHLAAANLIGFDLINYSPLSADLPAGPVDNSFYTLGNDQGTDLSGPVIGLSITYGRYVGASIQAALTPLEALQIDRALDGDEDPTDGKILAYDASGSTCRSGNNYDLDITIPSCYIVYRLSSGDVEQTATRANCSSAQVGTSRMSATETCPDGFRGRVMESCIDGSWAITNRFCEDVTCDGGGRYGDTRALDCPDGYTGTGIVQTCGSSGIWAETSVSCTVTTAACSPDGSVTLRSCIWGEAGRVQQTCSSGNWSTTSDTCANIQCAAADIGATRTGVLACPANYTSGLITETCTIDGTYKPTSNTCVPNYGSCTNGTPDRDILCPSGEVGSHIQTCAATAGAYSWTTLTNTCQPVSCGDAEEASIGTAKPASALECPDDQEGSVLEVCDTDGLWDAVYSNCTAACNGAVVENEGNATWPNANASVSNVIGTCNSGYTGSPRRNCNASGEWEEPTEICYNASSIPTANLVLWLDAEQPETLTMDASNRVSSWQDKSGSQYHVSAAGTARPLFVANDANGRGAIYFTTGDSMGGGTVNITSASGNTTFVVMEQESYTGCNFSVGAWNDVLIGGCNVGSCFAPQGGEMLNWAGGGANYQAEFATDINQNQYYIVTAHHDAATLRLRLDGAYVNDGVTKAMISNASTLGIGASTAGGGCNHIGHIAEILMYDTGLSDTEVQQVESYLSNKWGIGTESVPISGLQLWLDADDADTITKDGSNNVSAWNDKSGNSNHAAQGVLANQPLWVASGLNSKDVIQFGAGTDIMTSPVNLRWGNASDITVVTLFSKIPNAATNQTLWGNYADCWGRMGLLAYSLGPGLSTGSTVYSIAPLGTDNVWQTFTAQYQHGVTNGSTAWIGGVQQGTFTESQCGSDATSFYIGGAAPALTAFGASAQIAELLAYNRVLSTAEREQIESYLIDKWAISTSEVAAEPDDYSGLTLWLDANNPKGDGTQHADGALMGSWTDLSGSGYTLTATDSERPLYRLNAQNGLPAVEFDGSNNYMYNLTDMDLSSGLTFYFVAKHDLNKNYNGFFSLRPSMSVEARMDIFKNANTWIVYGADRNTGSLSYFRNISLVQGPTVGDFGVYSVRVSSDTSMVDNDLYVDGTEIVPNSTVTTSLFPDAVVANNFRPYLAVGRGSAPITAVDLFDGQIAEVIIYNRGLSDAERRSIELYLLNKWNLP